MRTIAEIITGYLSLSSLFMLYWVRLKADQKRLLGDKYECDDMPYAQRSSAVEPFPSHGQIESTALKLVPKSTIKDSPIVTVAGV